MRSPRGTVPCIVSMRNPGRNSTLRRVAILLALIVATTLLAAGVAVTQAPEEDADTYIVVLKESPTAVGSVASRLASRHSGRIGHVYSSALRGFSVNLTPAAARRLAADPDVAYVEQAVMTPSTAAVPTTATATVRMSPARSVAVPTASRRASS